MTRAIGVIGLGVMGLPIARNMMAAGYSVIGFDIAADAMPSEAALQDVVSGAGGLVEMRSSALVIAECSTLPIAGKMVASDRLAEAGIMMLDCPLSGTGVQGEARDLVVFGSGPYAAYELCLPAFQAMSRIQHHLGGGRQWQSHEVRGKSSG